MTEVGEHYRATDAEERGPVYRVVGCREDVTLLRVTDADGGRVHSGELSRVPPRRLDASFEPVSDPDAGLSPVADARNLLSGMYWQVRKFL